MQQVTSPSMALEMQSSDFPAADILRAVGSETSQLLISSPGSPPPVGWPHLGTVPVEQDTPMPPPSCPCRALERRHLQPPPGLVLLALC